MRLARTAPSRDVKYPKLRDGIDRKPLPGDEEVIGTADQSRAIILNVVGAAVADLCDGTHSVDDITAFICEHIEGAERKLVRVDVARIVAELRDQQLLDEA